MDSLRKGNKIIVLFVQHAKVYIYYYIDGIYIPTVLQSVFEDIG